MEIIPLAAKPKAVYRPKSGTSPLTMIFGVLGVLSFLIGLLVLYDARQAIQEIGGLISLLIAVGFWVGAGIVERLGRLIEAAQWLLDD